MATNVTPTFPPARRDSRQVTNTLKRILNFNDSDAALAAFFSSIPAGAVVTKVLVVVLTAFNATTNTFSLGQNGGHNDMAAVGDVNLGVTGAYDIERGVGLAAIINATADVAISAVYTQTGAAATAGKALIMVEYEGGWLS
jgi:hypothetical protein